MSDATTMSESWDNTAAFTDEEALARLIEYAREEASRTGEVVCAELLGAALSALAGFAAMRGDPALSPSSALALY